MKTQARNTRRNRLVTWNGETYCVSEWAERLGFRENILRERLGKLKWTIEKALTTPPNPRKARYKHQSP